jgi:RNA polymerase sigma-70 factor, ECF subfamily
MQNPAHNLSDPGWYGPAPVVRPAFEAVFAEHRSALEVRARVLCRGHVSADDVIQDTVTRALPRYAELQDPGRAKAWLLTILFSVFVDHCRALKRAPGGATLEEGEQVPAPAEPPLDSERVSREQFLSCVARLPDKLRECYRLFALEGHDYNAISARLDIPKSTVGTRLLRARQELLKMLRGVLAREGERI